MQALQSARSCLGACPTLTVLLRRTICRHLRRSRPEKLLDVFQRIRLRFFQACPPVVRQTGGLASDRTSFASSRTARSDGLLGSLLLFALLFACPVQAQPAQPAPDKTASSPAEFSASLVKQVQGRRSYATVFAKADRLRIAYKYAVKTELGYAGIEIVRLDKLETWFILAQHRQILVSPVQVEEVLPIRPRLPGERRRLLIGDATAAGRSAKLFEVWTDYNGRAERFYEWIDADADVVLKLVSQDRDWSMEYDRVNFPTQPASYFEEPPGYSRWRRPTVPNRRG